MWTPHPEHPIRRFFSGYTEQTFHQSLGIADPPLIDYLAELLARFLHQDSLQRLRDSEGKPLTEVADMMLEASALPPEGRTTREVHRHIGDFTLFWTGVFPESIERRRASWSKDQLINYAAQGKRSYFIASTFADEPYREEAPLLRRLSDEFDLFAYGLNQVRREWERDCTDGGGGRLIR